MIFFTPNLQGLANKDLKAFWIVTNLLSIPGVVFFLINYFNSKSEYWNYHWCYLGLPSTFEPPVWMLISLIAFSLFNGIALFVLLCEFVAEHIK